MDKQKKEAGRRLASFFQAIKNRLNILRCNLFLTK